MSKSSASASASVSGPGTPSPSRSPLFILFLIVLIDLMGFTLVMPLLQRFAGEYGFSRLQIGALLAAYPACQLFAGPILGRLSDRYGRRPVLVFSQLGASVSFLILGLTRQFEIMLLARMLDGASGGNILVAQAYVADVTSPRDRARGLGMIGAAFGIGFVLGPLLGGTLVKLPVDPDWQTRIPFLVAAGFSTLAWFLVLFWLPESRPAAVREAAAAERGPVPPLPFSGVLATLRRPGVAGLVLAATLFVLAFTALEGTFSLYLKARLGWDPGQAAWAFAYLGFVSAFVQGGLLRHLVKRLGEPRVAVIGGLLLAFGMLLMTRVHDWTVYAAAATLVALGYGMTSPSLNALVSKSVPHADQGAVFGTLVSAQTVARMINYVFANLLTDWLGDAAPYFEAALLAAIATAVTLPAVAAIRSRSGEGGGEGSSGNVPV